MPNPILDSSDPSLFDVRSKAPGPAGSLPITPEMLLHRPSGDLFGWTHDAGMGWDPSALGGKEFLILSTHGGIRAADGTPIALGYHTGHWEVGLLMEAAAKELKSLGAIPFAAYCTDPCDGRTQGTTGMFDSLPYRNDAASVFKRLIRSLPTRSGVLGVATCDKGLPAMMMALAAMHDLPCVLIPGGVTLLAEEGEDAGKVQSSGARFAHGQITLAAAAQDLCRACATPGGGCQFLGTAATAQVVGEALGMSLPHSALAPSGHPIWSDMARRSARAALALEARGITMKHILEDASVRNALVVHAAFGGSTNLILHLPAIAYSAGLRRPTVEDWTRVNRQTPRLVDALPNGPKMHPTVQVFLAGGVPEVMLHLRRAGLLETRVLTVSGEPLGAMLDWWEQSERRAALRRVLRERDGVDPDDVIMDPEGARRRGLTSTVTFPAGNLAPGGSVIKSTALDPSVVDAAGVYRKTGPARVFLAEKAAISAIKNGGIAAGDVLVLMCRGPLGSGMEEIFEITAALRYLDFGKHVAVITDARFSGVSTGACVGHITPEALAGGPLGKIREGDLIEIAVDRVKLEGSVNLVGANGARFSPEEGARLLASRAVREDLAPDPAMPPETRLWAALQDASGGTWGGCVFDVDAIAQALTRDAGPVTSPPIAVLTKEEIIAALQHEVNILVHLAGKVDPSRLDYRPTPKQRSTLELLQYLAIMGPTQIGIIRAGTYNRAALSAAWSPAEAAAKAMTFDQALAAIRKQSGDYGRLLSGWSDADFRGEIDMFGHRVTRGSMLVTQVLSAHAAYRTQLFCYLKSCGREELSTMDLWAGTDGSMTAG